MRALISTWVAGLVLLVALTGCSTGAEGDRSGDRSGDPAPHPADYAGYLVARDTQRRVVPALVEELAFALGAQPDALHAQWETCRQEGEDTVAFSYSVRTVLRGARVEEGLPTVVLMLEGRGWTLDEAPTRHGVGQLVTASRDEGRGIGVVVSEGRPADRLLVRSSTRCFEVDEADREELRELDRGARLS